MSLKNWDDLKFCLALDRYGTMTAAADHLGTNTATVSRRIERMTADAGQPLFTKVGQAWKPTPLADHLITIAVQTESLLADTEAEDLAAEEQSDIRINAPIRILHSNLAPILGEIVRDIKDVTLIVSFDTASLAFGEADIVLSTIKPREGRLVRKKIGMIEWRTYCDAAHKDNIKGWADLVNHGAATPGQTELQKYFGQPSMLRMEGVHLMREIMRTAPVVCRFPCQFALSQKGLFEIDIAPPVSAEVWLSYHYTRRRDQLIRRVVDRLSEFK